MITPADLLAAGSLPAAWAANWRAEPNRPVLADRGGAWIAAGELDERTARLAGRLAGAGLRRGDRVLLSGPTSSDLVVAHCAAMRAGLVVVPVNSAYSPRELRVIAEDAEPRAAILAAENLRDAIASTHPALLVTDLGIDLPDTAPTGLDRSRPDDPALLPYTSGTTGTPKGALLSHGNLLASAEALRRAWRWTPDDRLLLSLPLFHMHGLGVGVHGTLLAGASMLLIDRFDPAVVLAESANATLFFGVPTMYSRLVRAAGAARLGRLRLCVSGSAPMSAELHAVVEATCGQRVIERYGMTETVMLTSNPYDGERKAGTVGLPLHGVELRLGAGNEIEVRGPNVFAGYWRRPDATADCFSEAADGHRPWFRTGDIGELDPDGYLRIVGRAKELIITGGYNVYPREIEDVLRGHPAVVDVAVVGEPSEEWGEVVTAFVEPGAGFDADDLVRWASEHLAPYKLPRRVHEIDALPRNRLGKVVRGDLTERPPHAGHRDVPA